MKKLPLGISTFSELINNNYVYVDKTRIIHEIIEQGKYFFLARPRRFGKSLLMSTLHELFLGNKELFKDLWIGKENNYTWPKHPVISLDFTQLANSSPEDLKASLARRLEMVGKKYNIDVEKEPTIQDKLISLVMELSKQDGVVILIDEYDYPLLAHIATNVELAQENQKILANFFATIKSLNEYFRFIFLTGVSKFSKTSIFSGLNNLRDISEDPIAGTLCGYTQEELELFFGEHINSTCKSIDVNRSDLLDQLKQWYNGYSFSDKFIKIYNPFSIIYFFTTKKFADYWFASGTPTFLINILQQRAKAGVLTDLQGGTASEAVLRSFTIDTMPTITLMYQTGYLTLTAFDIKTQKFTLNFPNHEVSYALSNCLIPALAYMDQAKSERLLDSLSDSLENKNLAMFCKTLTALFANIPYHLHIAQESYYHSLLQFVVTLLNIDGQSEIATDKGRIDMVINTKQYTYIFELKFGKDPEDALHQIENKKYYEKYLLNKKQIVLVGIAFDRTEKELEMTFVENNT